MKAPASFDGFKPNILRTNVSFEANVAPHLIPDSLYVGKKQMSKLKGVVNAVMALKPGGFTSTPKAAATKPGKYQLHGTLFVIYIYMIFYTVMVHRTGLFVIGLILSPLRNPKASC